MVCKKCGQENDQDAKFCVGCGEKLSEGNVCPNCGEELIEGAKFCASCGQKVGGDILVKPEYPKRTNYAYFTTAAVDPKAHLEVEKNVSTILMLITFLFGLITSTLPIFSGCFFDLSYGSKSIYSYSMLEYVISNNGNAIYLLPTILLFILNILIIVITIFGLVRSIQMFSHKTEDESVMKKIFFAFVAVFFMMFLIAQGCVVDSYNSTSLNPTVVLTVLLIIATFIFNLIREFYKKDQLAQNIYRIINFCLLFAALLFIANSVINFVGFDNYSDRTFHPFGYLASLYENKKVIGDTIPLPVTKEAFIKAWLFFISYFGLITSVAIHIAKTIICKVTKPSLILNGLNAFFGIFFIVMEIVICSSYQAFGFSPIYTATITSILVLVIFNFIYYFVLKKEETKIL